MKVYILAAAIAATGALRLSSEMSSQEKLYELMNAGEPRPFDDEMVQLTRHKGRPRPIYDADGDGVEDNVKKTYKELDDFYYPCQFGSVDEINNTHHGNLPGHVQKYWYDKEGEPTPGKFSLV